MTCKNMGLRIERCECMHKTSEIDFFVLGSQIKTEDIWNIETGESDRNLAFFDFCLEDVRVH